MKVQVFRAATLSIVMTLAMGQSAALLCSTWCRPQATAANDCRHQGSDQTPIVTPSHGCPDMVLGATVVREDLRRGLSTSIAHSAVIAVPDQFGSKGTAPESDSDIPPGQSSRHRLLATALRL
jgi:hypothetical protein